MKRKFLLIVGLAIGYVIGARAGREKYDRLKSAAQHYWSDPRVTRVRSDIEGYARTQAPIVRDRAETIAKDVAEKTSATARDVAATAKDIAEKTSATAKDVAATAKDIADKTATTAKDVADRTSATARSVVGRVGGVADDVKDQVVKTASDIKDRGEDAVERVTLSVSEARDRALEDDLDDDENDDDNRPDENRADDVAEPAAPVVDPFSAEASGPDAPAEAPTDDDAPADDDQKA
jgi:cell division septum initiation protein DivIVA